MLKRIFFFNLFYAIVSTILSVFFLGLGIFGIFFSISSKVRTDMLQLFLEYSSTIALFGIGFIVIGLLIAVNLFLTARKRYYHIRSGPRQVLLDETLFKDYLEDYLQKVFPNYSVSHQLVLKKNRMYIKANLPAMPSEQQSILVERMRSDIEEQFSKVLGYRGEFILSAHFQKK